MVSQFRLVLAATALATVAAVGAAQAPQSQPDAAQQPAPIQRAYPGQYQSGQMAQPVAPAPVGPVSIAPGQTLSSAADIETAMPIEGVMLRVGTRSSVREVSSDPQKLELSVQRGVANVNVHDPGKDVLILVDLPGGQTQLLKNGLYTFDAQTNTARVLKGEALAFPGADKSTGVKPLKVKENHDVVFNGTDVKSHEFAPYEARMDLLAPPPMPGQGGSGYYGYGPYGDGFYGYPSWAYDYYPGAWGAWGYPYYGYGYPFGVGLGFGYVGGFHGGGFGGFHGGGGFHGRR
jgi:hypothetical protein